MLTRRVTATLASSRGLFVTAVVAGSLSGLAFLGIGESTHLVTAQFADADGLVQGNEVRVAGVTDGAVQSVHIAVDPSSGRQYAEVQFSVDAAHWPLHQGTTVAVKPKGVLSNVYVDLQPGPVADPAMGNAPFFALSQTQSPVGLDELSNVFTPSVTEAIRTQLQEGVLALGGAGADNLNSTIANVDPLSLDAIPITSVLAARSPQLDRLNFEFDTISGELAREDSSLRPLIVNLNTLLGALAVKEQDLQGTLVHAGNVFKEVAGALGDAKTQADLQNIFTYGPNALSCADALAASFSPLIAAVNPHVSSLDTLLMEFVTATGYNADMAGIDTLRIDPTLPPNGYTSAESGGLGKEHYPGYLSTPPSGPTWNFPAALSNGCKAPAGGVTP